MTDAPDSRTTGTARVKRGLAEMLRGGVIMDVVDADQARVAEDAGAVAVMALERVPSDIRRDGGVARMSDPAMIEGIQAAVTIPVMAKCRIGHFAEAQVLESLGVDYIDESEVLTPADEAFHVDKWAFTAPFVCGATNLGEALRRIGEGAALIRSKGEAGTGNIVEAIRHLRSILGDVRRLTVADEAELFGWAKELQAPLPLIQEVAERGELPSRCSPRAGSRPRPTPPSSCSWAPSPCSSGAGSSRATTRPRGPRRSSRPRRTSVMRRSSPRCHATSVMRCAARRSARSTSSLPSVAGDRGAPQRGRRERCRGDGAPRPWPSSACWRSRGRSASIVRCSTRSASACIEVRVPSDLSGLDALVLPGGESTTMTRLLGTSGLRDPLVERLRDGLPALGTCAGLILLAAEVRDGRADQVPLGVLDVDVRRNGYGRQRDSFESALAVEGLPGGAFPGVFIRAPLIERVGEGVAVLAAHDDVPVLVRQGSIWASTFHPELSGDLRVHQHFLQHIAS